MYLYFVNLISDFERKDVVDALLRNKQTASIPMNDGTN